MKKNNIKIFSRKKFRKKIFSEKNVCEKVFFYKNKLLTKNLGNNFFQIFFLGNCFSENLFFFVNLFL